MNLSVPIQEHRPRPFVLSRSQHRRVIWIGLLAETAFVFLSLVKLWAKVPSPVYQVDPAANNLQLALTDLSTAFPALLVFALATLLLILLPGWIASLFLETRPSLLGSVLFGFASFGGLVMVSQLLRLHSIWPTVCLHLGWQWVVWLVSARQRAADLPRLRSWQIAVVGTSMALISLFSVYLNPAVRLSSVDNWAYTMLTGRLTDQVGTTLGQARWDLNAWVTLNAWLSALTGIAPVHVYHLLWGMILLPLLILVVFGITHRLTHHAPLATASAWFAMLVLITGSGTLIAPATSLSVYLTSTSYMAGSDKWLSLALLVPAGVVLVVDQVRDRLSWRGILIILVALGASAIFHPQGLTALTWLVAACLAIECVRRRAPYKKQKLALLVICLLILFVLIPVVFPRAYSYTASKNGETQGTGLWLGSYLAISPELFVVNPALLAIPLLIGPILLILLQGYRRDPQLGHAPRLFWSWTWAVAILFFPLIPNLLDKFWFPSWLDRFTWTLPFGALAAVSLWRLLRPLQRRWRPSYLVVTLVLTAILIPLSRITPNDVDWRLDQVPVADQDVFDVVRYFHDAKENVGGPVLSAMPGLQTALMGILGYSRYLYAPTFGFPDAQRLYATPWWGEKTLRTYIANQVNWIIVERADTIAPQIGLQPDRYQLTYENRVYLVYRVVKPFALTPIDTLVDTLATPDKLEARLSSLPADTAYAQVITGLAYKTILQCDRGLSLLEKAVAQSNFARIPYLQTLVDCHQPDKLRERAAAWRDDPNLAGVLLSADIIKVLDYPTIETALKNWLARPNIQRDEVAQARTTAQNLASLAGRPDLAIAALRRLPDVLMSADDWYRLAYWSELAAKPDPALYRRAGREDLALLLEGHLSHDLPAARDFYQRAVNQSHTATAYMFLGQACDALQDTACARTAYQAVMNLPDDPMAFYGALALARMQSRSGEDSSQADKLAHDFASSLSLTYFDGMPAPVIRPVMAGQPLNTVLVSAEWDQPVTDHIPAQRSLAITFTNPLPSGNAAYTILNAGKPIDVVPYVPLDASVRWTIPVTLPEISSSAAPVSLRPISIFEGRDAFIAETLSWLPPQVNVDANSGQKPLTTFGDGLQLWKASLTCNESNGPTLSLTWLPTAPIQERYTFFVHSFDDAGQSISLLDQQPFNNAYPTDFWLTGFAFETRFTLPSQQKLSPHLEIGWWLQQDGSRLPLKDNPGANGIFTLPVMPCLP